MSQSNLKAAGDDVSQAPEEISKPDDKTLYIDANEPPEVQAQIVETVDSRGLDVDVEVEGLKTGDIVLGDIVFERKRDGDLLGSITDGRISEQSKRMATDFDKCYVLLEGNPYVNSRGIHPNAIVGTFTSLTAKKDIHVVPVANSEQLAYAVYKICDVHLNNGEFNPAEYRLKRSMADAEDVGLAMLSAVEGITKSKAERILEPYDSFGQFAAMAHDAPDRTEEKMQEIDGIGGTLSDRVTDAFQ